MAKYIQMNVFCPTCNKEMVGVLVKEDANSYVCKECGTSCRLPEPNTPVNSYLSRVNKDSDSYRWGRHIDDVKFKKWNVHRGETKK